MEHLVARSTPATNVFEPGKLRVKLITVEKSNNSSSPPKPLVIFTPTVQGTYPVLMFLNGFCIRNTCYSELLQHISSHGFIVVAHELYVYMFTSGTEEVKSAAEVTNWLSTGLESMLPEKVQADLGKLALSGHSRGGKAAFALALEPAQTSLTFSVLLGLDPLAGPNKESEIDPKILTNVPRSFNLDIPVAVIGTDLGEKPKWSQPCAPEGVNHKEFFKESKPPCYHFVAKDYGHTDMLDDGIELAVASLIFCESGKGAKDPFRKCLGGIFVAFLRAYLEGERADLKAIVDDPAIAPVLLDDPVIYTEA